jgi:DNA processing protein
MPSSWKPPARFACSTPSETPNPDTTPAWLRLLSIAQSGHRRWLDALRFAGSIDAMLAMAPAALRRFGLSADDSARFRSGSLEPPAEWLDWLSRPGHDLVVYGSALYPEALCEASDAPLALWVDGRDKSVLGHPQLAIVGSRHPTSNGRNTAEALAAGLSESGITVTSGLALGIDAASHRGAMTGAGKTIAVLGSGIDCIYPASNRDLAAEIRESGAIVSEYGPATPVRAYQFPRRNRIIAALSLGTLVVEATRRSGSLITAAIAAEYGREVFSVPGSIHSPLSKGCHKLIRDGAKLVESIDDILIEIMPQLRAANDESQARETSTIADDFPPRLACMLDYSPMTLDALVLATGLTAAELSSMLLHLEIQGKIEALPGGRYCRLAKRA